MQSPKEVKNWYLNDSYNTNVNSYKGEKLSDNYRFACTIPQIVIDKLLTKQSENQIYLGSNLSVIEKVNSEISYELFFYTYTYNNDSKNYLIGRSLYEIVNYSIDYKQYLNSKEYIQLNITIDNLVLNKIIFTQAYKQNNEIGALRLDAYNDEKKYFSLFDIYLNKIRERYSVSNINDINYYYNTPIYIYKYLSRTLSTCVFSCELCKQLKPTNLKGMSIIETNIPFN